SYLGVSSASDTSLVCAKKAFGSSTFSAPKTVPNIGADKNLMTIDHTGGPFNNRIYIAWDNNTSNGQTLQLARSTDSGSSFTAVKVNDTGTTVIGADPAVGP